jgi:4-amino-4-deoxy-L-arabinose transferase-like glycosyltransferase
MKVLWENRLPIFLFAFAFLIRLCLIFALKTYSFPYHFSEHVSIADQILAGRGYSYSWYGLGATGNGSFMPPLYVGIVLIAKLFFPTAPWLAIQLFQAMLSAATIVLVYFFSKALFDVLTGAVAAALGMFYPPVLGYMLDIQSQTIETFLVTFLVFAGVLWRESFTWKRAAVTGLAWALVILTRPNLVLFLPFWILWIVQADRCRNVTTVAIVVSVLALIVGPWLHRNYLVHDRFVFVSTNGGFNLFQGNNPDATGVVPSNLGEIWRQQPGLARELAPLSEAERDRRLYQASFLFIQEHPQAFLGLSLKKLGYFWWFRPSFIKAGRSGGYPAYFGLIYMISYAAILFFFLLSIVLNWRRYREFWLLYALFALQTVVSMVFLTSIRFRSILEPLMMVLAGYGIVWTIRRFSGAQVDA